MPLPHDIENENKSADAVVSSDAVVGRFADANNAELAAGTALKNGFAVRLLDRTTVAIEPGPQPRHRGEIEGILAAYGAINIPATSTSTRGPAGPSDAVKVRGDMGTRVELMEEELQPRTRPVVAGEVLIRKHVVNETVTIEVPVQREELVIERLPLDRRSADQPDVGASGDPLVQALTERLREMQPGEALRVPVVEEEVIVTKRPIISSEVLIGKRLVREIQHFTDTIRREVADIDTHGDVRVAEQEEQP
jgi:stress response protein YsnF